MSDTALMTTYSLSTMMWFTGLLIAVFEMDVLSQAQIDALGAVLLAGGAVGLVGSLVLDYRNTSSTDLGVEVGE
jgi:hypothetical protein